MGLIHINTLVSKSGDVSDMHSENGGRSELT